MQAEQKICTRCEQMLALDQFVRDRNKKDGRASLCKACNRLRQSEFRVANREHVLGYGRQWYKKNAESMVAKTARWRSKIVEKNSIDLPPPPQSKRCPCCGQTKHGLEFSVSIHAKDGRMTNCKACMSEKQKLWRQNNPVAAAEKDKRRWSKLSDDEKLAMTNRATAWHKDHIDQRRKERLIRHKERIKTDQNYYWQFRIRNAVLLGLKGVRKSSSTEQLLGCSFGDLRRYLQGLWEPWMSWANYGRSDGQWSIDHIVPVSAFDLTDPEQQKLCFHYINLRPLRHCDNRKKACAFNPSDLEALRNRVNELNQKEQI